MPPATVSFTVRRPTPASSDGSLRAPRHVGKSPLAGGDSDSDGETGIVFANGADTGDDDGDRTDSSDEGHFNSQGTRRTQHKKKTAAASSPLVIPTQPNPDWREAAKRRRAACARVQPAVPSFIPDAAPTGPDGSVGGLGTRDTINAGPERVGLQIHRRVTTLEAESVDQAVVVEQSTEHVEETEDQRALRAILAGDTDAAPIVDIIPVPPLSEADALKQDVHELPDVATPDDYERVPISAFGAAMLRGMGWTDGAVAPKKRKNALTELYLPQARPALLGIGAKEREVEDDGGGKKKSKGRDMRYIPVARRESANESSRSGTTSRRSSRSPSRRVNEDRDRSAYDDRDRGKERDRDRDREDSRRRTRDYDDRDRDRKDRRDRDRDRGRSDPYRDRESDRDAKGKYDQRDRSRQAGPSR